MIIALGKIQLFFHRPQAAIEEHKAFGVLKEFDFAQLSKTALRRFGSVQRIALVANQIGSTLRQKNVHNSVKIRIRGRWGRSIALGGQNQMKLPAFLSGLFGLVILSVFIGIWAAYPIGQLVLFIVAVLVVVQLAYLAVIVGMSFIHHRERVLGRRSRISRGLSRLLRQNQQ